MPTGPAGHAKWARSFLRSKIVIGDLEFRGQFPVTVERAPGPVQLKMFDGSVVSQRMWHGPDRPMSVRELALGIDFLVKYEDEYLVLRRYEARDEPFDFWPEYWVEDAWYIPGADAGQTVWKTSRYLPYGWMSITHATHPPVAYIDSTAQTIITTGTPTASQVLVPDTALAKTITTPALTAGTDLRLYYPARLKGVFSDVSESRPQQNLLRYAFTFAEAPV